MKKIFLLALLAVFFTACGDDDNGGGNDDGGKKPTPPPGVDTVWLGDWNNRNDPAFKPEYKERYCPMLDEWKVIKKNGQPYNDILIYDFRVRVWDTSTETSSNGSPIYRGNSIDIFINNKQIKDKATGRIFEYQLRVSETEDKLIIFDGRDTFECEVSRFSNFTDIADWNSIWDRHYELYKGKYNPIKGKWKAVKEGEFPITGTSIYYFRFSDDFYRTEIYYNGIEATPEKYSLNDKFIKVVDSKNKDYRISNDTLYLDDSYEVYIRER